MYMCLRVDLKKEKEKADASVGGGLDILEIIRLNLSTFCVLFLTQWCKLRMQVACVCASVCVQQGVDWQTPHKPLI